MKRVSRFRWLSALVLLGAAGAGVRAEPPSLETLDGTYAGALAAFAVDAASPSWRDELPPNCRTVTKTPMSALVCELQFRGDVFERAAWSNGSPPGGGDDCARRRMLREIRLAQEDLAGPSSSQRVRSFLDQPFAIVPVQMPGTGMPPAERRVMFRGNDEIELAAETVSPDPSNCAVQSSAHLETLVEAAVFLNGYIGAINTERMRANVGRLRATADNWKWFLDRGRSQLPWEVAFNEWFGPEMDTIFSLPRTQWVFMHPSPVFEIYDGDNADWALAIEPIGMTWYDWETGPYRSNRYWGVSAVVSLADDGDAGVGAVVNYNGVLLGLNYRNDGRSGDGSEWALMLSLDLWRAFTGKGSAPEGISTFLARDLD